MFILETRYAISCVVEFYNAGVVTRDLGRAFFKVGENIFDSKRTNLLAVL
jgi:hypothetical protein